MTIRLLTGERNAGRGASAVADLMPGFGPIGLERDVAEKDGMTQIALFLLALPALVLSGSGVAADRRPNFVIIMADVEDRSTAASQAP